MDLKKVRKNLGKGKYKKYECFFGDLSLVWNNCKQYNRQDSEIYKKADHLEKFTKRLIRKFKDEVKMRKGSNSS